MGEKREVMLKGEACERMSLKLVIVQGINQMTHEEQILRSHLKEEVIPCILAGILEEGSIYKSQ